MLDSNDDDELFKQTVPSNDEQDSSKATTIETELNSTEVKKKPKKKKRKAKTANLPEAGSNIPDDYVEKYNEDPENDPFNPARPLGQRVEYAMAKYRKNHKFSISKKNIFDDYLRFGGINTGQNAFLGRTTGSDNPGDELVEEDFEAANAGIDAMDDDLDDDTTVSFSEVAQIYFGSRFIRQSKFIQLSEFHEAPSVVDAFLRYLEIRNVCPEYADDIAKARAICEAARHELPNCKVLINMFPDKFNQACCVVFEGQQKDIVDFIPTWNTGDSNLEATYGSFLSDIVGMTKPEAVAIVEPIVGKHDDRKVVNKISMQKVKVVHVEGQPGATPESSITNACQSNPQHSASGVYVMVRVCKYEQESEQYSIFLEKRIGERFIPNMVFSADFYQLDNGQWYVDQVCSLFPSFYIEEGEDSDTDM
ncbi:Argonaute siRNA chaperone complex subunit Arb1-domain-containing protein [Umbelopsis sp. AD052]|nr:Argonaute siRNA chaperone complex subunit Arb1-domain-containing protein [Umbelopsis sp. AD052]